MAGKNNGKITFTQEQLALAQSLVREEDLEELEEILKTLRDSYDKASADGRLFMMSQYIQLINVIQGETHRIRARFQRESIAAARKEAKALRLAAREAKEAEAANA